MKTQSQFAAGGEGGDDGGRTVKVEDKCKEPSDVGAGRPKPSRVAQRLQIPRGINNNKEILETARALSRGLAKICRPGAYLAAPNYLERQRTAALEADGGQCMHWYDKNRRPGDTLEGAIEISDDDDDDLEDAVHFQPVVVPHFPVHHPDRGNNFIEEQNFIRLEALTGACN